MGSVNSVDSDFKFDLEQKQKIINEMLEQVLSDQLDIDSDLMEALEYVLLGDGKRIRPSLVLWSCELFSGKINHNARISAAAIEMVHTYSLVHDDLPAMDDDDFRRGKETCHKKFDEATAILAGDGLLTLAFEIIAKQVDKPETAVELMGELAEASGAAGMIGGQMADLRAEKTEASKELLEYIHTNKTGRMFGCSAAMGAICGGGDEEDVRRLSNYGLKIGLGFQIADDILDVCGTSEELGKTAGKDVRQGKATYPALVGLEESHRFGQELADGAVALLEPYGERAESLKKLAFMVLERTK